MSCDNKPCSESVAVQCDSCPGIKLFCGRHGVEHKNVLKHDVNLLNKEVIQMLLSKLFKSKIKNCIRKISEDTIRVISVLNQQSKSAIKQLKELNRNLKNVTDFKELILNRNRVLFLEKQAKFMTEALSINYDNDINMIFDELNTKRKEIEALEKEILSLKEKPKQPAITYCKYE